MTSPLLQTKSQLQRLHEIQQAGPRLQRPSSCVQQAQPVSDTQTTLTHPTQPTIFNLANQSVSSPVSQPVLQTSCAPAVGVISPSLTVSTSSPALHTSIDGRSQPSQSSQPVTYTATEPICQSYPIYHSYQSCCANHPTTLQSPASSQGCAMQGCQFQAYQQAQPLRISIPSESTAEHAVSTPSQSPDKFGNPKDRHRVGHYRQLKEDLDLAKRLKMELPDDLMERIKRLHVQSSILEKLREPDVEQPSDSRLSRLSPTIPTTPSVPAEVQRPLEELQQAISAVKAEQGAMRRMQEEELLELCKVRHLLEREEKEKKEKEREQEILRQIQIQKQAKEQQSKHDVALRVEQALFSQGTRREEFLQAELRQLDEEEKEVERRNTELKRQAEALHSVSLTQQPKIAAKHPREVHTEPFPRSAVIPEPVPVKAAEDFQHWTSGAVPSAVKTPRLPSPELPEPVCQTSPAPTLSPVGWLGGGCGNKLVVGQGPLWQSSANLTETRQGSEAWTEEEQQESLMQAYLAFINKEVESVPTLDPAGGPLGEGSSIAMQGDPPTSFGAGEKRSGGLEDLPQVYRAAITIVAEHGWNALHGGENAGPCWTALHWAAAEGRSDVCQLLLRCRADANHQDEMGRCPAYYASLHGHASTLALLKETLGHSKAAKKTCGTEEEKDGGMVSLGSTRASFPLVEHGASSWSSATLNHVSS